MVSYCSIFNVRIVALTRPLLGSPKGGLNSEIELYWDLDQTSLVVQT